MAIDKTNLKTQVQARIDGLTGAETLKDLLVLNKSAQGLGLNSLALVNAIQDEISSLSSNSDEKNLLLLNSISSSLGAEGDVPVGGYLRFSSDSPKIIETEKGCVYLRTGCLDGDIQAYPDKEPVYGLGRDLNPVNLFTGSSPDRISGVTYDPVDQNLIYIGEGSRGRAFYGNLSDRYIGTYFYAGTESNNDRFVGAAAFTDNYIWYEFRAYRNSDWIYGVLKVNRSDTSQKEEIFSIAGVTASIRNIRLFSLDGGLWVQHGSINSNTPTKIDEEDVSIVLDTMSLDSFVINGIENVLKIDDKTYIAQSRSMQEVDLVNKTPVGDVINIYDHVSKYNNSTFSFSYPDCLYWDAENRLLRYVVFYWDYDENESIADEVSFSFEYGVGDPVLKISEGAPLYLRIK